MAKKTVENKINPFGIRYLRADEIDVRVNTVEPTWCTVLLYKDARVDMYILDEMYGVGYWQRQHEVINGNLFCTISIWNKDIQQWVKKQDVGTESMSAKEKGEASDSFKRAGVNIGIGRELYTTPKSMFISLSAGEAYKNKNGKMALNRKVIFKVSKIDYDDAGNIIELVITDNNNKVRYNHKSGEPIYLPQNEQVESEGKVIPQDTKSEQIDPSPVSESEDKITKEQINTIHVLATSIFGTEDVAKKDNTSRYRVNMYKNFKVSSSKDLTKQQASQFIKGLQQALENKK